MFRIHFADNRQAPIWLVKERFTLGKDSRNDLVLDDPEVAAFHAELRQDQDYYYLSDCSGAAGTFVNDVRIGTRFQIRANDRVRLGGVELLLVEPGRAEAKVQLSPRWFLQVVKGEQAGKKLHIHGSMTFGRSSKCELSFSDPQLSRRHCEFYLKDDILEVKDLASANGVQVNQQKVGTAVLQSGDQLKMGSISLLVIGPKVEVAPVEDEDATQFMRAIDLPLPAKSSVASTGMAKSNANPLRSADQANPVAKPAAATVAAGTRAGLAPAIWLALVVGAGVLVALATLL